MTMLVKNKHTGSTSRIYLAGNICYWTLIFGTGFSPSNFEPNQILSYLSKFIRPNHISLRGPPVAVLPSLLDRSTTKPNWRDGPMNGLQNKAHAAIAPWNIGKESLASSRRRIELRPAAICHQNSKTHISATCQFVIAYKASSSCHQQLVCVRLWAMLWPTSISKCAIRWASIQWSLVS